MVNLELILEHYKKLSTPELIKLSKKPDTLEPTIIPHLQMELINRGEKEEALLMSEFLINKHKPVEEVRPKLSQSELLESIKIRVESGENIESIKMDLKHQGLDLFNKLDGEVKLKNMSVEYLESLKNDNLEDDVIDEKMQAAFGISAVENDILKRELRRKGKQNLVIGYSIIFLSILVVGLSFVAGGGVGIGGIVLFASGIWQIVRGHEMRK